MYFNVKTFCKNLEADVSITEFYPLVDDVTVICPASFTGLVMLPFVKVKPDVLSVGPLPDEYILPEEEYFKRLDEMMEEVAERSDYNVELLFPKKTLYKRYEQACRKLSISGVVSAVSTASNSIETIGSDTIMYIPDIGSGEQTCLHLEDYWIILSYTLTNILTDASSVIEMHKNYTMEMGCPSLVHNKLILESRGIADFIDRIREGVGEIDDKTLKSIVRDVDDVDVNPELIEYYQFMMSEYELGQSTATFMLSYLFKTYYTKLYSRDGIKLDDYLGTNRIIVITIPDKKKQIFKTSGSLL